jgi:hypothetical protein
VVPIDGVIASKVKGPPLGRTRRELSRQRLCFETKEAAGISKPELQNGQTNTYSGLRGGDGSRYSQRGFRVLQKQILGAVDREHRSCSGVRSFLPKISYAPMIATGA